MPTSNITTLLLTDDELDCTESAKEDTEAMFIDSISNTGYIIQKVRERNTNKSSVIFKVLTIILWRCTCQSILYNREIRN